VDKAKLPELLGLFDDTIAQISMPVKFEKN
jgi:hypothetical protein